MSNDKPENKKDLPSGPEKSASAPDANPSSKGGKARHFRDEFEVFLSDKHNKGAKKASTAASQVPRSNRPQVVKSADLSKDFEFFTKSSKSQGRVPASAPVQGVTAPAPVVVPPEKAAVLPPPVVPASPAKKEESVAVPPPPPKIEKKAPVEAEKPKPAPSPVPAPAPTPAPAQKPSVPAAAKTPAPAPAPAAVPAAQKKPEPIAPVRKPGVGTSPADIFAPRPKAAAPAVAVAPTPEVTPAPVPAVKTAATAAPIVSAKPEPATLKTPEPAAKPAPVIPPPPVPVAAKTETPKAPASAVAAQVPAQVDTPTSAGNVPVAKTTPTEIPLLNPALAGTHSIKKVELDPNRKKRPAIVLAPLDEKEAAAGTPPPVRKSEKKKLSSLIWVFVVVLLLLLAGVGAYVYEITRETSAEIALNMEDLAMSRSPLIIYNFDGQVSQIKRDYSERRNPMETRLQEIEADLAAAKADLAGREEKKRLLTGQITKLRDSIPVLVAEGEKNLDRLWKDEGGALDKAYAAQKETLHKEIEKRAQDLGLKYEKNQELDALEVAVNAFRLSLYGAPKSVNVDEQRIFSEDLLKRWRDFEKDWAKKQLAIKEKAMEIKQAPGPRITDAEKQIETLKVDLDALNVDLASLQEEVNRRQQDEVEEQEKLREVEKPFLSDLLKIPSNNILREVTLESEGKFKLPNLEKSTDMPPGEYLLFVQGQKGDEIFWAFKSFVISKHKKTSVEISRKDFTPIRKLIQ